MMSSHVNQLILEPKHAFLRPRRNPGAAYQIY